MIICTIIIIIALYLVVGSVISALYKVFFNRIKEPSPDTIITFLCIAFWPVFIIADILYFIFRLYLKLSDYIVEQIDGLIHKRMLDKGMIKNNLPKMHKDKCDHCYYYFEGICTAENRYDFKRLCPFYHGSSKGSKKQ